jgi:hypothetical protein
MILLLERSKLLDEGAGVASRPLIELLDIAK